MKNQEFSKDLSPEFIFSTSRSSGPGGQNVNKVNSKVELKFCIASSQILSSAEKNLLTEKLFNKLTKDGELIITSQSERSQLANKEKTISKLYQLIKKTLTPQKSRIATKPSKKSKEERIDFKKRQSAKKDLRKSIKL